MKVNKRDKVWQYDFRYDGKRYRKSGFNTKKEATISMNKAYENLRNNVALQEKIPFIDYFKSWIKINKESLVSSSTVTRYYNALRIFDEKFGDTPINQISQLKYREMLKEYSEGKFVGGRKQGRTKASVSKLNNCFSQTFKDAVNDGLISRDPTWNAPIYEYKPAKSEDTKFMTATQLKALKKYSMSSNELSYLVLFILIVTGARFGEVQRLKYSDINYKKNTIHLPGTKSKSADRIVSVSPKDLEHIQNVIETRVSNTQIEYLFHTGTSLITNNAVTKTLQRFLLKNALGAYTLHAIRHTHASVLLANGLSIQYVSKRLGHSDINITWRVYSHLLEEQKSEEDEQLIKTLDAL